MTSRPRLRTYAPLISAGILLALAVARLWTEAPSADTTAYMARVAERIDAMPYRIGRFIGVDAEVTPGAVELLQPNRILQRRFKDPVTGEQFSLVIVHCKIAKDMAGHFPPNCYPRAGWEATEEADTVSLEAADTIVNASLYHFSLDNGLLPTRIDILNFFVVPSGPQRYGSDMRLIDLASRSAAGSRLGAAQVQIITPRGMDEATRESIWAQTMDVALPVLTEIAGGTL